MTAPRPPHAADPSAARRAEAREHDRPDLPLGADEPPGAGWHVRYVVAALYADGYGGASAFATEAEALAHCEMMRRDGGYKVVDVWARAIRWVVKEREGGAHE